MKHGLLALMLCAAAALAAAPVADAAERAPTELWDRFPLEPTATPAAAASPEATPRTRAVERPSDDGMEPGALIALMVAAGAIGAVAARLAARQLPRAPEPPQVLIAEPARGPSTVEAGQSRTDTTRSSRTPKVPKRVQPPGPEPTAAAPTIEPAETATPEPAAEPEPVDARAPRPEPLRQPAAPEAPRFRLGHSAEQLGDTYSTCRIKLHSRAIKSHFYAVPFDGGPVLARSPYFRIKQRDDEPGLEAPAALRALVAELTAAGWAQTGAGRAPWDLRFERTPAGQPSGPRHRP